MAFPLFSFSPIPLLFCDLAQSGQRLFGPEQMRIQLELPKSRRHLPIRGVGVLLVHGYLLMLCPFELLEQRALSLRHTLNVPNQDFRRNLCAEEELDRTSV